MAVAGLPARSVRANDLEFGILEVGSGPLALCLHGFPDCAHTWRNLLPELADAGFNAVAPFMRGYAPTGIPADGVYQIGALAADAVALHDALGGDAEAVLIGHDWGAEAPTRRRPAARTGGAGWASGWWPLLVVRPVSRPLKRSQWFETYIESYERVWASARPYGEDDAA